jgi:hypothetical protein
MPRVVHFSIDSSATVAQIHGAFAKEDYWVARMAAFGGIGRLDSLSVGPDDALNVVLVHDVRDGALPSIVAKVYPARWQVVQKETWLPVGADSLRDEVDFATHGAPGSGHGTSLLAPAGDGSRLDCDAKVEFRVPLLGGTIEGLVGRYLPQQFSEIQRFTSTWIAQR